MNEQLGKVVCVTGASGFIGSWIVKHLLQRGYVVRVTVRDLNDPKKTGHLLSLDGAKERLKLFKGDLMEEGSFDSAIDGCDGVFHTASPVFHSCSDPQAELIDPAVKGTLNVLKSCVKAASVKRVIFTSTAGTLMHSERQITPDTVLDETWFSDPSVCKERKLWYELAKTLAEKAAWDFAKQNGVDLVVTNPAIVIGPLLQPTLNESTEILIKLLDGETYSNSYFRTIDVRDVADAHIQAFEIASASGRYILSSNLHHASEILKIIHEHCPTLHIPQEYDENKVIFPYFQYSTEKLKTLGIKFISMEVTLKDTVGSLNEKGFLKL